MQIDLEIEEKRGGMLRKALVECKDTRVTAAERDQILAQRALAPHLYAGYQSAAISTHGFSADARAALERAGISCVTYADLLEELAPLDRYVRSLLNEIEDWRERHWKGQDWFIRPHLSVEGIDENPRALDHFGKWLRDSRANLLVILGDLGTGKTTLASF